MEVGGAHRQKGEPFSGTLCGHSQTRGHTSPLWTGLQPGTASWNGSYTSSKSIYHLVNLPGCWGEFENWPFKFKHSERLTLKLRTLWSGNVLGTRDDLLHRHSKPALLPTETCHVFHQSCLLATETVFLAVWVTGRSTSFGTTWTGSWVLCPNFSSCLTWSKVLKLSVPGFFVV